MTPGSAQTFTNWNFSQNGIVTDLQNQNINCGYGRALTGFQLMRSGNNIRYENWCLHSHSGVAGNTENYYNTNSSPYNQYGGSTDKLSNLGIFCPNKKALQQFRLQLVGNQIRYQYSCIKANISNCFDKVTQWTYGGSSQTFDLSYLKVKVDNQYSQIINGFRLNTKMQGNTIYYRYYTNVCNVQQAYQAPTNTYQAPTNTYQAPTNTYTPPANNNTGNVTTKLYPSATGWVYGGNGNVSDISKITIQCAGSRALTFMKLNKSGYNIEYAKNCLAHPSIKSEISTYHTNWSSRLSPNGQGGATQQLKFHNILCPFGKALAFLKLDLSGNSMKYQYKCIRVDVTSCYDKYTNWINSGYLNDFKTFNLDQQYIQVNNQYTEVIQQFRLDSSRIGNRTDFRYYTRVCTLKTVYQPTTPVQPTYKPPTTYKPYTPVQPTYKPPTTYKPTTPVQPAAVPNGTNGLSYGATPWVNGGDGNVKNLAKLTIDCGARALVYYKFNTSGSNISYSKNCLKHPAIKSQIINQYTNWSSRIGTGGATNLLKNHAVDCKKGWALAYLKLTLDGNDWPYHKMSYHFKCIKADVTNCYTKFTNWQSSSTGLNPSLNKFQISALSLLKIKPNAQTSQIIQAAALVTSAVGGSFTDYRYRITECNLKDASSYNTNPPNNNTTPPKNNTTPPKINIIPPKIDTNPPKKYPIQPEIDPTPVDPTTIPNSPLYTPTINNKDDDTMEREPHTRKRRRFK